MAAFGGAPSCHSPPAHSSFGGEVLQPSPFAPSPGPWVFHQSLASSCPLVRRRETESLWVFVLSRFVLKDKTSQIE